MEGGRSRAFHQVGKKSSFKKKVEKKNQCVGGATPALLRADSAALCVIAVARPPPFFPPTQDVANHGGRVYAHSKYL